MKAVLDKAQDTLGQALGKLFEQADDTLFDLAGPSQGAGGASFFEGFREMRLRRQAIERVFRERLVDGFSAWEASVARKDDPEGADAPAPAPTPGLGELSLVSDEQFEEDLAINAMVEHADGLVRAERPALERRLSAMRGGSEREVVDNPLSPSAIAAAFRAAMKEVEDVALPVRLVVYKLFDRQVMVRLPELYHRVNHDLASAGILPELAQASAPRTDQPTIPLAAPGEPAEVSLFGSAPAPVSIDLGMTGLPNEPVPPPMDPAAAGATGHMLNTHGAVAGPAAGGASGGAAVAGHAGASPQDVMGLLHALLAQSQAARPAVAASAMPAAGWNGLPAHLVLSPPGAALNAAAPAGPILVYSEAQLLSAIGRLRATVSAAAPAEPAALRAQLSGLLTAAPSSGLSRPDSHSISSEHQVAIEMISMLFEFIAEDHALSADLRATLGRLQLPYLRAAIHDPELFAKDEHPARQLLNQMAEAGKGCPEHDHSPLSELIEQTVDRIFQSPDDDRDVFARELANFSQSLDAIRQRSERLAERAQQTLAARERRESVRRHVAESLIAQLDASPRLPAVLREVIMRAWAHNLVMMRLRYGDDAPQLQRADRVVTYLARLCAAGDLSDADRRQLDDQKSEILTVWREGLFYAGLHEADVRVMEQRLQSLMDELLDPLAVAAEHRRRNQLPLQSPSPPASSSADSSELLLSRVPHPSIEDALAPAEVVPLSPEATRPMVAAAPLEQAAPADLDKDGVAQAATELPQDEPWPGEVPLRPATLNLSDREHAPSAPEDSPLALDMDVDVASSSRTDADEAPVPTSSDTPVEIAMSLQKGQWIELRAGPDDTPRRLRLSWVSGMTGRLLFVNTYGQGSWDTTREEVANRIATGTLVLVESGEVVERAMTSIGERLRRRLGGLLGGQSRSVTAEPS